MTPVDKAKKRHSPNKISMPQRGEPLGRIRCPRCGNDTQFLERLEGIVMTTAYMQNADGSFTQVEQESDVKGEMCFLCGECGYDLTPLHEHFREMTF